MGAEWFAGRLRELREAVGLTQKELADKAGIAKATVADLEQGRYAPSWPTVVTLAEALGVECTAFLQAPRADVERPGPGRPRKPPVEDAGQQQPKRPRGRPRKASVATQDGLSPSGMGNVSKEKMTGNGGRKAKGD